MRNALFYMVLTTVMLVFLNAYSANSTRQMIFRSKAATMQDKAALVSSSLAGLDMLDRENTAQVMQVLGDLNVTQLLITDVDGLVLYDSNGSQLGTQADLEPVNKSLEGYNVFRSHYEGGTLDSYAASPIMRYDSPMGCVYVSELDGQEGALIHSLETNTMRLSLGVELLLILSSVVFAVVTSGKMRQVFDSMAKVREGDYSEKIAFRGADEYARLAKEFNKLTDRLQASVQAQRQFVSDASHELKTPLASIKLLSDSILQNDMDTATMREFVGDIGSEADRLNRLTQKLLSISKAENVSQEHELVDLSQVLTKVFKMLVSLADERDIRLISHMDPGCTVLSMEDDMYQILFNLVENAIKYNRDGGTVRASIRRREEELVITVADTGIGIPAEAMDHVFERFYRVDKARSRQQGGSGLGLSIVHDLVDRNFGAIQVAPGETEGTVFTVTFPAFDVEDPAGMMRDPL